jgi:hypothetical protein
MKKLERVMVACRCQSRLTWIKLATNKFEELEASLRQLNEEIGGNTFFNISDGLLESRLFIEIFCRCCSFSEFDPKDFLGLWSAFASDFNDIWNPEQQRIF